MYLPTTTKIATGPDWSDGPLQCCRPTHRAVERDGRRGVSSRQCLMGKLPKVEPAPPMLAAAGVELAIFAFALIAAAAAVLYGIGIQIAKAWRRRKLEALMRHASAGLFTVNEATTLAAVRSALPNLCAFLDEAAAEADKPEQALLTSRLAQSYCFTAHGPADLAALRLLAALGPSWWMLGLAKEGHERSARLHLLRRVPHDATEWWRTAGATAEKEAARIPLVPIELPLTVWEALGAPAPPSAATAASPGPLESLVLACARRRSAVAACASCALGHRHSRTPTAHSAPTAVAGA